MKHGRQQELQFPVKRYVVTTREEDETCRTGLNRLYTLVNQLENELIIPRGHAVDWQAVYDACGRLQVEVAVIKSAIMHAKRGGHFRGHSAPSPEPAPYDSPDNPPWATSPNG